MTDYLEFLLNNIGIYLEFFLTQEHKVRIAPLRKWSSFSVVPNLPVKAEEFSL